MNPVSGTWYDGITSRATDMVLHLDDARVVRGDPPLFAPVRLGNLHIESRVGSVARHVRFPDGAVLASTDHDALDAWLALDAPHANLVHRLESRLAPALAALVVVAALLVGGAFWAVPRFATYLAEVFPPAWAQRLGAGSLEVLDELMLAPTDVPAGDQERLAEMFKLLVDESGAGQDMTLHFRRAGSANAFALPDGSIVVTDELVALLDDAQLAGVLLHEIGHVAHRHNLRAFISHVGLAGLTMTLFGDVSAAGSIALGLPNALLASAYSRELEWEADGYALTQLERVGLPAEVFAEALELLEAGPADPDALVPVDGPDCSALEPEHDGPVDPLPTLDESLAAADGVGDDAWPLPQPRKPVTSLEACIEARARVRRMLDELPERIEVGIEPAAEHTADADNAPAPADPSSPEAVTREMRVALGRSWMNYLSTHPVTAERKARFRAAPVEP